MSSAPHAPGSADLVPTPSSSPTSSSASSSASSAASSSARRLVASYGRPEATGPADRPQVRVNTVASLDGAVSVGGVVGPLGGGADHEVLLGLRAVADGVVVGAGTVRAERYGPVVVDEGWAAWREARGLGPPPPLVVLTGSCDLEWGGPAFAAAPTRPVVITVSGAAADAASRAAAAAVATVLVEGDTRVDLRRALGTLAGRGMRHVVVEGGPVLNGALLAADLIDEWCLTIAPTLVGGTGPRAVVGAPAGDHRFELVAHEVIDRFVFLRYVRRHHTG